ncbi:mitochondrial inner membrane protein OXA1L-like [Montipora capricornis]|uniref:mitochondrial inner membrane protein OXA1L-like n=1 Tax=Montipora capricornis TaxID=246305 RepID=UPI0035F112FF
MAALFLCVGRNGRHFQRTLACLKTWRVSLRTNHEIFADVSARNYVTYTEVKRSSHTLRKFMYRYRSVPVAVQSGRFLSVWPWSSSSPSSDVSTEMSPELELMKNEELTPHGTNDSVTNPFLQENAPDSMLESGLLEDMADTVASLGEPTLASLGLGGYSPAGLIQQALELIHVSGNVSWCLSIVIFTLIVRTVCLPLIIKAQANTAKLNNIRPQLEEAQAKLRELTNSQDAAAKATASMKLAQLYKDNGCHPIKSVLAPLVQIPLFISFFMGLRTMANFPVESFKTGGYLWFQDLTVFDPYFILPVICSFSMLASVELGSEMGVSNPSMKTMKTVMRIVAVATIPITAQFPAAIFAYWVTSNLFTVGQVAVLSHPAARKAMGIPEMVAYQSDNSGNFWENMKAGYTNSQEVAYIKHAEKMKRQRQKALGEAPLEPTYELNPRVKQNMEIFQSVQNEYGQSHQSTIDAGSPGQPEVKDPDFKPKRVKFNQDIFSGAMSRQAKKEKQRERDRLRNRPGGIM